GRARGEDAKPLARGRSRLSWTGHDLKVTTELGRPAAPQPSKQSVGESVRPPSATDYPSPRVDVVGAPVESSFGRCRCHEMAGGRKLLRGPDSETEAARPIAAPVPGPAARTSR